MQEFINWGGETPEQLAERRRFEEEIREFTINKMLMEAARAQGKASSAAAAGGGGGEKVINPFNQTSLIMYADSATPDFFSYFVIDFENLRISETYDTGLNLNDWELDARYPLNENGYVLVFRSFATNEYKFFCLDKFGAPVTTVEMGPSSDISYGRVDALHFWAYDFDGSFFMAFNGTDYYQSTTILGENLQSVSVGSVNGVHSPKDQLIVTIRSNDQVTETHSIYLIDYTAENQVLTYEVDPEDPTYIELSADPFSDYLVMVQRAAGTGEPIGFGVIDLAGNGLAAEVFDVEDPAITVDVQYYGTSGSIVIEVITVLHRKLFFFDPVRSTASFDSIVVLNSEYSGSQLNFYHRSVQGTYSNTAHNTVVVKFYKNPTSMSAGLHSYESFAIVSKFEGDEALFDTPAFDSVLIYDSYQNSDVILVPATVDGVFKVYTITRDSRLVNDISEISTPIADLQNFRADQIGDKFLYIIGYTNNSWLLGYSNQLGAIRTQDFFVGGPENYDYATKGDVVVVFDTTNHHTYSISNSSDQGWTEISNNFGTNSTNNNRYYLESLEFTPAIVQINQNARLYWFSDEGSSNSGNNYISDGGDDMYDGGNYMNTNLGQGIPYTHTSLSDEGEVLDITQFYKDGAVQDGVDYFGADSEYFTNLYPGLFVMSAVNPTITEFYLDGGNGADGSGQTDSSQVVLGNGYVVSYKRIWDAGDPSITQLIITKATGLSGTSGNNGVPLQEVSNDTDETYHSVYQLDQIGLTEIHYLLFALADGHEVTETQIVNLSNAYIATISQNENTNTAQGYLDLLNSNYESITSQVPPHIANSLDLRIISEAGTNLITLPISDTNGVEIGRDSVLVPYIDSASGLACATLLDFNANIIGQIQTEDTNISNTYAVKDRYLFITRTPGQGVSYYSAHAINANGTVSKKYERASGSSIFRLINDSPWND